MDCKNSLFFQLSGQYGQGVWNLGYFSTDEEKREKLGLLHSPPDSAAQPKAAEPADFAAPTRFQTKKNKFFFTIEKFLFNDLIRWESK